MEGLGNLVTRELSASTSIGPGTGDKALAKRITLADVAASAGLSTSTVSMVLNDRPGSRIPEATAARVRRVAKDLGYAPDRTARGLRTGRSEALGFISDEVTVTRYASAMVRGILDAAELSSHAVLMAETDNQPRRVENAIRLMRTRHIDGILIGMMRSRLIELPGDAGGLPIIIVNGKVHGFASVLPDEYRAGIDAVEYLVAHGHRKIALIGRAPEHLDPHVSWTIGRRLAGIDTAMANAGLSFVCEVGGVDWEPELGDRAAAQIFDQGEATAIIAANDRIAFGVYWAAQERGLKIPDDISVLSFDDEQLASYVRPQITTMRLPYLDMGRVAADRLLQQIGQPVEAGSDDACEEILVPMPLVERNSVATLA